MDLVKFRQSLTSPSIGPALPPLDLEKEPNGEDLLRLVDEVTRDDDFGPFRGQRKTSAASFNNGSSSYSPGNSLAHSSHIFAPPMHPSGANRVVRGSSPPPFHTVSNGAVDRARSADPLTHSDSPMNGGSPQFPRLDDRLMQGFSPPPHHAPPPSFETTIAQLRESHGTSPMLHGAPGPVAANSRVPETLIVRNDYGVFLLQPLHSAAGGHSHGISPLARALPGGSPPMYGAPHVPPPPYVESPVLGHMLPPPYGMTQSPVPHTARDELPPPPPYELTPSPAAKAGE